MLLSLVSCPPPEVLNYWCIYKDAASTINFGMDSEDSRTVYCGNLPSKITEELLYELFLQVTIVYNFILIYTIYFRYDLAVIYLSVY